SLGVFAALVALLACGVMLITQPANAQPPAGPPSSQRLAGQAPATPVCNYSVAQATATLVPGTTDIGNHCDDCATTINLPFSYQLYGTNFLTATVTDNGTLQFIGNST